MSSSNVAETLHDTPNRVTLDFTIMAPSPEVTKKFEVFRFLASKVFAMLHHYLRPTNTFWHLLG